MYSKLDNWKEKYFKSNLDNTLKNIVTLLFIILLLATMVSALPQGPNVIFNSTSNYTPKPGAAITTAGGSFTTLALNVTGQTYRWKAYVGNVTGTLTLADATNMSIFDWTLSSVTGEVYATRNNSIDWSSIACANDATIDYTDLDLNMSLSAPDTLNKTFNETIHRSFYVGTTFIPQSTCRAIATYVNGARQAPSVNAAFQQILLEDSSSKLVYSSIISQNATGYNGQKYDFQMIVPENEYQSTPSTYYLYVELI